MPSSDRPPSSPRLRLFPRMRIDAPGVNMMTGLVLVMLVIHLLLEWAGGPLEAPEYYMTFGLSWGQFSQGRIWQLVTYGLLHGDWFHLLINVLMLWLVGGRVIHILGTGKCFQIIVLGALGGGLFHLLTGALVLRTGHEESQLVGISGACLALLLTLTTLSPDSRMWPIPVSGKLLGLGIISAELLLWLMQPGLGLPLFSQMGEQMVVWGGGGAATMFKISHACHFGGAMVGWWLARRLIAPTPSLEMLQKMRQKREGEREGEWEGERETREERSDCGDLG